MSRSIQNVEGIGPKNAGLLNQQGIYTTSKLLEVGRNRSGRKEIADKTSISESRILKWVNLCDLFRINGIAGQFAELLECAGVDTVKELRNRNAENLAEKIKEVNEQKHLCKVTPSASNISDWIEQAKTMEPMVTY